MDAIQAILDRIGTDNPPTSEELATAKAELVALMKSEKAGTPDLAVLQALKAGYDQIVEAETETAAREAAVQAQIDELLEGVELGDDTADEPTEPEATTETTTEEEEEKEPVLAGGGVRILSLGEAAARVKDRPQPPTPPAPDKGFKTFVNGRETDADVSMDDLVAQFAKQTRNPSEGKHTILRYELQEGEGYSKLHDNIGKRTNQVDSVVSPEAVAAAGGCCILPRPIREQTVLSSTATPIRDSLPSFGVTTEGAVTFYPPVCFPQDGAAVWTCDDDAAVDPDDPNTWKTCAVFECDDPVVTTIDAIYRCITIGEFQRRFDAERWRAVLQTLLSSHARLQETHLWTKMQAAVTSNHILGNTGSVFVSLVQGLGLISEIARQDQRLADVNLRLWAPGWLRQAIRSDLIARRIVHIDNPVAADQMLTTALGNVGVNVTWTMDTDLIDAHPINSGPLPDYPAFANLVLAPEGYYTYLNGGEFDLGTEIRDFNLARQNAVAAFAEQFQGLMARGCNAFGLQLPVAVCDLADGCVPVS